MKLHEVISEPYWKCIRVGGAEIWMEARDSLLAHRLNAEGRCEQTPNFLMRARISIGVFIRPSVRPSVRLSVRPLVRPSVGRSVVHCAFF